MDFAEHTADYHALSRAAAAEPGDHLRKLVLADWADEQSPPHPIGALIRKAAEQGHPPAPVGENLAGAFTGDDLRHRSSVYLRRVYDDPNGDRGEGYDADAGDRLWLGHDYLDLDATRRTGRHAPLRVGATVSPDEAESLIRAWPIDTVYYPQHARDALLAAVKRHRQLYGDDTGPRVYARRLARFYASR